MLQEAKKKYDKETEKYCAVLEKNLSLSARKKESHLHEVRYRVFGFAPVFLLAPDWSVRVLSVPFPRCRPTTR